jgi:hypothetical protein
MVKEEMIKTGIENDGLRDIADGTIRFGIKAPDTLENLQIHNAFKNYCKIETDNNYTQGLKRLMEYYQGDFKYEMIFEKLEAQSIALENLKASIVEMNKKPKSEADEDASF